MATILFTYELGAGLGHLNRLIAVAKCLSTNHRLVFAVPAPSRERALIHRALGHEVEVRQGMLWPAPTGPAVRQVPTLTFADVACLFGLHRFDRLFNTTCAASDLLRDVSPRLIVADFAPTLRLASAGKVPMVVVGNGYTVPPLGQPLPLMRPWGEGMRPQSRAHEAMLLAAFNAVSARLAGPAFDFFADTFHGEQSFVCTLAEFDPYRIARNAPPLWPFNIPRIRASRSLGERCGESIFCYFQNGHPALLPILAGLSQIECKSDIYVQGIDPEYIVRRVSQRVHVHRRQADLAVVLPEATLLLHHAGLGTAYAGLVAGLTQVVFPINLEHLITTRGLEQFGVAVPVDTKRAGDPAQVRNVLQRALRDADRQRAAAKAARELEVRRDDDSVLRVVSACAAYL